ncbi:MAG: site-specific integrase [Bacteroidetes bacterium]|nr:site-specific integrase [Bacteroidota bacterium]
MGYGGLNIFLTLKRKSLGAGSTPDDGDEHLIYIDCNFGRTDRTRVYTGLKVYRKDWDPTKKAVRRTDPEWALKNRMISELIEKGKRTAHQIMIKSETREDRVTGWKAAMVNQIRPLPVQVKEPFSFEQTFNEILLKQGNRINEGTLKVYRTAFKYLREFCIQEGKPVNPEKFNSDFMQGFLSFLYSEVGLTDNTAHKVIRTLQAAAKKTQKTETYKQAGITIHPDFFESLSMVKTRKAGKIFLTLPELQSIIALKPRTAKIERIRDLFIFQCLTGLRYSDLKTMTREAVKDIKIEGKEYRFIEKRQEKTRDFVKIPLIPLAEEILIKYDFLLPVPSNQKYNEYLKELGQEAGLNEPVKITRYQGAKEITVTHPKWNLIGTHTARHTTATLGHQLGLPPKVVQATLGHSDLKTTMIYSHDDFRFNVVAFTEAFKKI